MTLHHSPRRRRLVQGAAGTLLTGPLALSRVAAQSDAWPSQTIKIIVPFAAGGVTDLLARTLTERLAPALKVAVVAENRPGAGSTLGAAQAAMAKPDGHTLMIMSTSHLFAPAIYKDLPYDALTAFIPVTRLTSSAYVMTVNNAVPANSVKEFIALAKAQPGKLNFGSSGAGGNQHLVTQMFLNAAGLDVKHIPYKGSSPALADLIGGQVQLGFMAVSNALPQVKAGRLRALAITSAQRSPEMPNLPTMIEAGMPGFTATAWLGMVVPKGTPAAVVARLDAELQKILATPETARTLAASGQDIDVAGAKEFATYVREESVRWLQLARSLNLSE